MMPLAVLKARREEVNSRLKAVSNEYQGRAKSLRRSMQRSAKDWQVPANVFSAAFVIFERCGWSLEPCEMFLEAFAKRKGWHEIEKVDFAFLLESAFLERDVNELVTLGEAHDANGDDFVIRTANKYIREWPIVEWCRLQNLSHGVAPTTAELIRKANEVAPECSCVISSRTSTGRPSAKARAWASKFRKRWNGRIGRIKIESGMDASEKRAKACI